MTRLANQQEIKEQSLRALDRWGIMWLDNAKKNKLNYKKLDDISNFGENQKISIFSFSPSFKKNIIDFKKNNMHYKTKIMCVDKALKSILENQIIPDFCYVADAQVSFEKYGDIDPLFCKRIILISTVTANPKWSDFWTKNGGKVYFVINKDGIRSHHIYRQYFNYDNKEAYIIPAGSNVFNSAYVFASLILNFKEIYLFATDYCYKMAGNYYGDNSKPIDTNLLVDKHRLNNHLTMLDVNGDLVQVSMNMSFSARWLMDFINQMHNARKNITINCTGSGILKTPIMGVLT